MSKKRPLRSLFHAQAKLSSGLVDDFLDGILGLADGLLGFALALLQGAAFDLKVRVAYGLSGALLDPAGGLVSHALDLVGSAAASELSLLQRKSVAEGITDRLSGIIVDSIDAAVAAVHEASTMNSSAVRAEFEAPTRAANGPQLCRRLSFAFLITHKRQPALGVNMA